MVATPNNWSASNITAPAMDFVAVSVADASTIPGGFKALYIGGAGDVTLTNFSGNVATFVGLTAGTILPVMGIRVQATASGTTATGIIALK